jgi:hypothetical protein
MSETPTKAKTAAEILAEDNKAQELFLASREEGIKNISASLTGMLKTAFDDLSQIGIDTFKKFKEINNLVVENKEIFEKFSKSYITFREITKTKDVFSGLSASTATFGTIQEQISSMGSEWTHLTQLMEKVPGGKTFNLMLSNIKDNASFGQRAEAQMVGMLSAGGNLNKMFDDQGDIIGNLAATTQKYENSLSNVAEANGMTIASVGKYAEAFNAIPGVMDENITMSENLGGEMSSLNAAMKVMTGSGQNMDAVMKAMSTAYVNLGNPMGAVNDKAGKGLTLFATMSTLSKDLNMQFGETAGFLGKVAEQFKYVGNNTEAAARVMMKFMDALRNTGLTSSASTDIIQGMIKSVGELTIGTKAFVSARSGGPGGFQGAMQMEKLNREGKSDEVMMMVLNTMKQQFGGRIVTSDEATKSQDAAAQFVKQREMMKSGVFGNMVGSGPGADEKATKLLDALASGNLGKAAKVGDKALESVANQGNSLQKETNTILNKVALASERTAMATQMSALMRMRENLGSGNSNILQLLSSGAMAAQSRGGDKESRELKGVTENEGKKINSQTMIDAYEQLSVGLKESLGGIKSMTEGALGDVTGGASALKMLNDKLKENNKNKDIQKNTPSLPDPNILTGATNGNVVNRKDLTRNADQRNRAGTMAAVTNANIQSKKEISVVVKVETNKEFEKFFTAKQSSTNNNINQEDDMNGFNAAPGRSPVHRSTFIKPKNDPGY